MCAAGAFCFAVNMNTFADVAFIVGAVMMIAGILHTLSYLVSGRGDNRLTDTALVEGVVTFFYGFAVINDQVTDGTLIMFFGTWLTLCGISRVSQGFYVSRFNPKDWAKIMPLGIVASVFGIVMMLPRLMSNVLPLMLVGGAMILDGLSILVFAMFMRRSDADPGKSEQAAKERAEAKKALMKAKREQRDRLRNLSKEEREAEQARIRAERKALEDQRKRERDEKRQARKAAEEAKYATIPISKEEISEIVNAAPAEQLEEDEKLAEVRREEELRTAAKTDIKMPSAIPQISFMHPLEAEKSSENDVKEVNISAINLKELEDSLAVEFEPVELEEPEIESKTVKPLSREEILESIENTKLPEQDVIDYVPINFDDLAAEFSEKPENGDDKRWTQTLNIDWKEVNILEG